MSKRALHDGHILRHEEIEQEKIFGEFSGVTKFGDPKQPGGALIIVRGENPIEGLRAGFFEELKFQAQKDWFPLTPELHCYLYFLADTQAHKLVSTYRARGVPQNSKKLFSLGRKKEAEKYCNTIIMTGSDLSDTITNADQIGYKHTRYHHQFLPPELALTKEDHLAMQSESVGHFKSEGAKIFFKKIRASFIQRKNVSAHLFEKGEEWHMFWFTYDDMNAAAKGKKPHWIEGDHIHYTSHLWGHAKDTVWARIKERSYKIEGVHIRYMDERR